MTEDIVRVLRIIEYTGPRSLVEKQISNSIHGTRCPGNGVIIRAATIGEYPEIMDRTYEPYAKQSEAMLNMLGKDPLTPESIDTGKP